MLSIIFKQQKKYKDMGANLMTASEKACLHAMISVGKLESTPAGRMNTNGMVSALLSDANRRGFRQLGEIGSKGRPLTGDNPVKLEVEIKRPNCGTAETAAVGLCDTGDAVTDLHAYLQPTVDRVRSAKRRITLQQFDDLCRSPQEYIALLIEDMAETVEDAVNADLVSLAFALMGNYSNGDDSKATASVQTVPILHPKGYIQQVAWTKVKGEYRKQKTNQMPIVVGGDILGTAADAKMLGGMGANAIGADGMARVVDDYYDTQLDSIIQGVLSDTNSHLLTWIPGSLQMLEWYQYKGAYEMAKEDYTTTTITVNGMKYDFAIKFSECGFYYDLSLMKHYGLMHIDDSLYTACGTGNNKLHFLAGCAEFVCTDY